MLYRVNVIVSIIFLLKSQVTVGIGYNCSDFTDDYGIHPLLECPPAKFMVENNLLECFDNYTKYFDGSRTSEGNVVRTNLLF